VIRGADAVHDHGGSIREVSRAGISLVTSTGGPAEIAATARRCERAGFASVWATEFYDRSATVAIAAMAQATSRIELGSAIAYAFGRTPLVLAAEARDLDELSGGRVTLGLGTGTRRMQQDWHGLDGEHPACRMEELLPLLRRLWRLHEGPIEHEGRFYRLRVQPTAPPREPYRGDTPIYMAGVNARMVEAAGAVSDGLIGHPLFTPRYVREVVRPALARGAERAGHRPPPVAGYITCSVAEDRDAARRGAAAIIAFNSTVKTYRATHRVAGFEREADAIRAAWARGDGEAMIAAVSDEMIDAIALAGTPDEVRERFTARWEGVYERSLLWPPAFLGEQGVRSTIEAFSVLCQADPEVAPHLAR
jgi:probable F420-dependent oxidoreductase